MRHRRTRLLHAKRCAPRTAYKGRTAFSRAESDRLSRAVEPACWANSSPARSCVTRVASCRSRIGSGKGHHRLDALRIRDRHELGLALAVLPERLNPQRCLDQGLDPDLIVASYSSARSGRVRPRQIRAMVGRFEPLSSCIAPAPQGCVLHQAQSVSIAAVAWPGIGPGKEGAAPAQAAAEDGTGAGMSASSISRARTAAGRLAKPSW